MTEENWFPKSNLLSKEMVNLKKIIYFGKSFVYAFHMSILEKK